MATKKASKKSTRGIASDGFEDVMKQITRVESEVKALRKMFVKRSRSGDFLEGSPKVVILKSRG